MDNTNNARIPILTVIIPCWNGERFLSEMLESILHQTFNDWRCIIIDDQSTDSSQKIIKGFQEKDSRFVLRVRDRSPKGAQTCRNIGFEMSQGSKYVIFFDCDDIIAPYCFEQRVTYLENNNSIDFAVFPAKVFHQSIVENNGDIYGVKWAENDLEAFWLGLLPFVVWNNIYRRESLAYNNINWDENVKSLQDSAFNMLTIIKGLKYEYVNSQVDYYWRIIENSSSVSTKVRNREDHLYSHIKFMNQLYNLMSVDQRKDCSQAIRTRMVTITSLYGEKIKSLFNKLPLVNNCSFFLLRLRILANYPKSSMLRKMLFPQLAQYYKSMYIYKKSKISNYSL